MNYIKKTQNPLYGRYPSKLTVNGSHAWFFQIKTSKINGYLRWNDMKGEECSHKISFNEECEKCELIAIKGRAWMKDRVIKDEARLAYLQSKQLKLIDEAKQDG